MLKLDKNLENNMPSTISIDADGYHFDFHNAITAYIFDEKQPSNPHFHGGFMKAVDIVAEFSDRILFIEIKDYRNFEDRFIELKSMSDEEKKQKREALRWLKDYLKYKFRDTYLYRYAELGPVDKDIHYICLLSLSSGVLQIIKKQLREELPVGQKGKRWTRSLAKSCQIVDLDTWNRILSTYATVKLIEPCSPQ